MTSAARPVLRDSPVAAWGQVARQLRAQIEGGDLEPGERIPAEVELAEAFRVSRITIRQALASLARENLIERRQGSGTFVSANLHRVQHDFFLSTPWRERLVEAGHTVESILTSTNEESFPRAIVRIFNLVPEAIGASAVMFARVHVVDGVAIGMTRSWVPLDLGRTIMLEPLVNGSLTQTLRERYQLTATSVVNYLSVGTADSTAARSLSVATDTPLMIVDASNATSDGRITEISRTSWVGSRVGFRVAADLS